MPDYKLKNGKLVTEDQLTKLAKSKNTTLDKIIELNGLTPVKEEPPKKQKDGAQGATAPLVNQAPKNTESSLDNGTSAYGSYLDEEGRSGFKEKPYNVQLEEYQNSYNEILNGTGIWEALSDMSPEVRRKYANKWVQPPKLTTQVYNRETDSYEAKATEDAKNLFIKNIPTDFSKFEDQKEFDTALEAGILNTMQADPVLQTEINKYEQKQKPALDSFLEDLQKKYDTTNPAELSLAEEEYKQKYKELVLTPVVDSPIYKSTVDQLSTVAGQVAEEQSRAFGRYDSKFLSGIDAAKRVLPDYIPDFWEAVVSGGINIGTGVKQSMLSTEQSLLEDYSKELKSLQDKLDSGTTAEDSPSSFGGTYSVKEGYTYGVTKGTVKEHVNFLKEKIKTYEDKVLESLENISETQKYQSLFNKADLADGISFTDIVRTVGEATPQLVLGTAGAVTGNPVISGLGFAGIFLQEYGANYYTALEEGLRRDVDGFDELPEEDRRALMLEALRDGKYANKAEAAGFAVASAGLERLGALKIVKNATRAVGLGKNFNNALGSLYRGEVKKVIGNAIATGKRMGISGISEFGTETAQGVLGQMSTGAQLDEGILSYVKLADAFEEGKAGFIVGTVIPGGAAVARQSVTELRNTARDIATRFDLNSNLKTVNKFFENAEQNLKNKLTTNNLSQEEYDAAINDLNDARNTGLSIPKDFSEQSKKEVFDLLLEKKKLQASIQGIDPDLATNAKSRIAEINAKLQVIAEVEADAKKGEKLRKSGLEGDFTATETDQEFAEQIASIKDSKGNRKYTDEEIEAGKNSRFGIFIAEDGSIIVNKALAKRANITTTARHEWLHKIILAAVNSSSEGAKQIGSDLMAFLESEFGKSIKGDATRFLKDLEGYKTKAAQQIARIEARDVNLKDWLNRGFINQNAYDEATKNDAKNKARLESNAFEEALTLMSEALANGDLVYNASFMTKVRDFIRRFLQTIPGAYGNIDLADGKATFDFIRDYNRLFDKGKFNKAFLEFAQTGTLKSADIKESTKITPEQKKLNDKVDSLVGPKDADGNYTVTKAEWDTGALFNAYNEIINGTAIDALIMRGIEGDSVYGKSKQDFIDDVKDGITGTIMRFNPEENNSLIGFINSQLDFRKGDVLKKYKKEAGIGGKSIDVDAGETGSIAELVAEETAEDTLGAEAKMLQQEAEINKKPTFLESLPVDQKIEEGKTYQEALENETAERIKRNVQLYDQKVSQNRTISPFIAELKIDISDAFYKPTKKFINEYKGGYEGFLADFKATLLNNYTTTYLAKHPLFRKGILKRVKGQWMPPRKINKNGIFKYEWVDENGKKLKIDRDNAAGRGLTSGPEFIKRNPNINSVIGVNEFVDYHFQDGALRKNKKQNPEDAVARQIASETALEIFQNDLLENGPLTQLFEDRAELLGKILSDNAAITIASDIDRGLIKFSEKSMKQPKIAPIHNKALNILADQGPAAMDAYLETLKDQDVADLVKNYFDNRLWENGLFADAKARNRGLAYENYIKKVIRASKVKDVSVSMIGKKQKVGGDIILSIGKNKIPIELKLNDVAQMSSFTARIADDGTVSFSRKGLDDAAGVKDLKKILSSKDYAAKVKAFQDEGLKFAKDKNLYAEVINGRLVAQKAVFEYLVEKGEQAELNVTVDSNESIINALYNDKDVYYMDLGNKGLFHLGEDVNKLNTPRLASPVQLYARWTRSSKIDGQDRYTTSLRVFPNLTGDINKSTISLSDPANIKDVLNDLNFQEQNILESNKIDTEINRMIQGVSGIPANEIVSKVRGTKLGKNKKGAIFVPYSHEDFLGLMYPLIGKGEQGNADLDFIKQTILTPFAKAEHNITRERLNTAAEFRALKKQINKELDPTSLSKFRALKKKINKVLGLTSLSKELGKEAIDGFTNEDAIRVWLWDNQQMDIPGLNEKDITKIKNKVMKNPPLAMYALKLRGLLQGKYPEPGNNWEGGNISYDIQQNLENTRREFHLKTWQENVDKMFSPENKAKLEAAFGPKYVEALNNMLQRMKTGRNRTQNNTRIENALLDYLNGSVAAIMALNTKSAVLQQLSNVNFINWTDNNPLKAAQAFANQQQYWRDVVDLLNSDYLRNRRSGLKINVTESELAEAAKSKNKVTAFIGLLGQKGFILTQYGDSFAIASGGATFFRNRFKSYSKETDADGNKLYTEEQAKEKAMADFMEISEDNQQSSRTDKISMQQASNLGRLFLAFANTPAQYARLTKKATLDLVNGRGDKKTNISKILYYGFVQNLYFSFLQQGLFSMLFDDDDEQEENPKKAKKAKQAFDMANSAFDSVLRGGGGIGGAAISMVKNLVIKAYEKSQKKQPMYSELAYEILQVSPPIDSKLTKLKQTGAAFDYNMWEIKNRGLALDNPALIAGARGTTAITNIPLDRLVVKAQNMQNALNSDLETWQRVASALGWQGWELGIDDPKKEEEAAKKKAEGKAKAKATRDQKAKEKKEAEEERLSKMTTQEIAYEEYQKRMKRKESGIEAAATRKRNKKSKDSLELEILKRSILKK
jgi:hypothetical protein